MKKNKVHVVRAKFTKKNRAKKAYGDFLKRMITAKKSVTDKSRTIVRRIKKKRVAPIPLPMRILADESKVPRSDMTSTVKYEDLVNAGEWRRPTQSCTIIGAKRSLSVVRAVYPLPVKTTSKTARWYKIRLANSDMKSEIFKNEIEELREWHRDSNLFKTPSYYKRKNKFDRMRRWISGKLSKK
ncbi:hypothetical protein SNEBB_007874 [Seison nebaliae]|nr:hypothetical protein SNEBB_007874 [Seison nebaliae]